MPASCLGLPHADGNGADERARSRGNREMSPRVLPVPLAGWVRLSAMSDGVAH